MRLHTLVTLIVLTAADAALAAEKVSVQLILDASGSMWNKLEDGRFRIVAAKEALTDLISALPDSPELNVGLRVYGSQVHYSEPGSCDDTKLFVPIQGVDRERMLLTVRRAKAVGSTPIAKSLELAAQDFSTEGKRLIVLVTDGEESCGGDMQAAVDKLRKAGIETELRIVGIGLSAEAVDRFSKFGTIVNVNDTRSLAEALREATKAVAAPAPAKEQQVTVRVLLLAKPVSGAEVQLVSAIGGKVSRLEAGTEPGTYGAKLLPGAYSARVKSAEADPAEQEFSGLAVSSEGETVLTLELETQIAVKLSVDPNSVPAGKPVTVRYEAAPGADKQWIGLGPVGVDDVYVNYADASGTSGTVEIRTQDQPGQYEARFYVGTAGEPSRPKGKSAPFEVTLAEAKVEPPAEAPAGSKIEVPWSGPDNQADFVTVVSPGAPEGNYQGYGNTRDGSPARFQVPDQPGDYEVRYVSGQSGRTLARAPVRVIAVETAVRPPESVPVSAEFEVPWTGPNNENDYVTVIEPSAPEGNYKNYANTRDGNPAHLSAPDQAGDYEVRYVSGQSSRTLAKAPVKVTAMGTTIQPPLSVAAGAEFDVPWSGPNGNGDYVTIVPVGAPEGNYDSYANTRDGTPAHLRAPTRPGQYEVRYVSNQSSRTLASVPIEVKDVQGSVEAPATVKAGEKFEVRWTGPNNRGDYLAVAKQGSPEGSYTTYQGTGTGSPLQLEAPAEPGAYEVRYVMEPGGRTLASAPLTVE